MKDNFKPGSFDLKRLTLSNFKGDTIELVKMFESISIYEDILSSTISASVIINESTDLVQNFPIIGEETVRIKLKTHDDLKEIDIELYVFEVADKVNSREGQNRYRLELVSKEVIAAKTKFVENSFSGVHPDVAISDILKKNLNSTKKFLFDKSANKVSFLPNRMRPFEVISYFTNRTVDARNPNAASFLFYETCDGYNFYSLDRLIKEKECHEYNFAQVAYSDSIDTKDSLYSIRKFHIAQQASPTDLITSGGLGTTTGVFDQLRRAYHTLTQNNSTKSDYDRLGHTSDNQKNKPVTENNPFKSDFANGIFRMVLKGQKDSTIGMRQNQLSEIFNNQILVVEVPGNTELRVGMMVKLNKPSDTGEDSKGKKQDRYMSGMYLVSSLKHVIVPNAENGHTVTMELVRGSYNNDHEENADKTIKRVKA